MLKPSGMMVSSILTSAVMISLYGNKLHTDYAARHQQEVEYNLLMNAVVPPKDINHFLASPKPVNLQGFKVLYENDHWDYYLNVFTFYPGMIDEIYPIPENLPPSLASILDSFQEAKHGLTPINFQERERWVKLIP